MTINPVIFLACLMAMFFLFIIMAIIIVALIKKDKYLNEKLNNAYVDIKSLAGRFEESTTAVSQDIACRLHEVANNIRA